MEMSEAFSSMLESLVVLVVEFCKILGLDNLAHNLEGLVKKSEDSETDAE